MKKQRKHYTPEEQVAILRRHLVEGMPISGLCDELGLQPTVFYRLAHLSGPAQTTYRAASLLLTSLFAIVIAAAILQTVAHTACCFVLKR
jgi:transposase-like protein